MTTRQDIQKPAPGAIIELFELDATAQGAASIYRFVNWANPQGGDVVWRGQTYTRYPVEAEGFELSGRGALPRPKLRVANATGLMGALAIELDDLLGARVTRWRTFVHYLDAVNFPVAQQSTPGVLTFARSTTATYYGTDGLLKSAAVDAARIDCEPGTGVVRGLLVEEQRTNVFKRSQEINDSQWSKFNANVSANVANAPDGTTTADRIVETAVNSTHAFRPTNTVGFASTGQIVTYSIYLRAAGRRYAIMHVASTITNAASVGIDLQTGAIVGAPFNNRGATNFVSAAITQCANGWYRCALTFDMGSSENCYAIVYLSANGANSSTDTGYSYLGDGTSGVEAWGAQFELGSFASSYIPTTTAAVTRAADNETATSLSAIGYSATAGGLTVTARAPASLAQAATLLSYNDNSTNNVIRFRMEAGGALKAEVIAGGVTQASLSLGTLTAGTQFRAALSYAANDIRGCLDGGAVQSDTSASIPTVDRAMIGRGASGEWWNSTISRHRYWSRALTNAELQALTSGGAVADLPAFDMDASTGALEVYTLAPFTPTADPNQYLSRDVWVVDRKSSENRVFIEFELAAPIDVAGVMLPRRQVVANVCAWRYRSAECGYAGGPVADRDDNPTNNPALDACGKRLASCKLRFGQTGVLPYGGFPGTRRIG